MRVLVTGGAGFIGSHLVDRLLQEGHQVRVLDILLPRVHVYGRPGYLSQETEFLEGDVRNKADWVRAMERVQVVFHQAAYQDYLPDYSRFFESNATSTALMFEVINEMKYPIEKVSVASSQAVYGEGQYECPNHGLVQPVTRSREQLGRGQWEVRCSLCGEESTPLS